MQGGRQDAQIQAARSGGGHANDGSHHHVKLFGRGGLQQLGNQQTRDFEVNQVGFDLAVFNRPDHRIECRVEQIGVSDFGARL